MLPEDHSEKLLVHIQTCLASIDSAAFECGDIDIQPVFNSLHRPCHYCSRHLGSRAVKLIVRVDYLCKGVSDVKQMEYPLYFCSVSKMKTFLNLLPEIFVRGYSRIQCPQALSE